MDLFIFDQPDSWLHAQLEVREVNPIAPVSEADLLRLADRPHWPAEHPIAQAIQRDMQARNLSTSSDTNGMRWTCQPHAGFEGELNGSRLLIGNDRLMAKADVPLDHAARAILNCHQQDDWTTLFIAAENPSDDKERHVSLLGVIGLSAPQPVDELPEPESIEPASIDSTPQSRHGWKIGLAMLCASAMLGMLVALMRVNPGETAVITRFGRVVDVCPTGVYWRWLWPFERTERVYTERVRALTVSDDAVLTGDLTDATLSASGERGVADQLVCYKANVQYRVSDPVAWISSRDRAEQILTRWTRSMVNEQIGYVTLDSLLGSHRGLVAKRCAVQLNRTISQLGIGVDVLDVGFNVLSPVQGTAELRVHEAFDAAEIAATDAQEIIADANDQRRRLITNANAHSAERITQADNRRERQTAFAATEAERFSKLQNAFNNNPEAVKHSLLLELLTKDLKNGRIVVIDTNRDQHAEPATSIAPTSSTTSQSAQQGGEQ